MHRDFPKGIIMTDQAAWHYISRVTLSEAWYEFKGAFRTAFLLGFFTLLLVGIPTAIIYFIGYGSFTSEGSSKLNQFLKSIPWWIIAPTAISLFFWLTRGQKIQMPKIDFKLWLVIAFVQFVTFAGFAFLPWWVMFPAYYVINFPLMLLDRLIEIGHKKAEEENKLTALNS